MRDFESKLTLTVSVPLSRACKKEASALYYRRDVSEIVPFLAAVVECVQ
jgi:hypothetical protein